MNLQPILNKKSRWAHMELELDVLGVVRKLVQYVVYMSKMKYLKKSVFLLASYPNSKLPIFGLKKF
jgi:hypothetical protein